MWSRSHQTEASSPVLIQAGAENFGLNRGMDEVLRPAGDADIPVFCQALGLPGLADIHVHFLPPRMLRRVWGYFDKAGPLVGVSRA